MHCIGNEADECRRRSDTQRPAHGSSNLPERRHIASRSKHVRVRVHVRKGFPTDFRQQQESATKLPDCCWWLPRRAMKVGSDTCLSPARPPASSSAMSFAPCQGKSKQPICCDGRQPARPRRFSSMVQPSTIESCLTGITAGNLPAVPLMIEWNAILAMSGRERNCGKRPLCTLRNPTQTSLRW